jgi:hypothetical protein
MSENTTNMKVEGEIKNIVVWTCFLHGHNKVTPLRVPKINILNKPKRRQRNPITEDIKHKVGKKTKAQNRQVKGDQMQVQVCSQR